MLAALSENVEVYASPELANAGHGDAPDVRRGVPDGGAEGAF
jgi:hypothetical protein